MTTVTEPGGHELVRVTDGRWYCQCGGSGGGGTEAKAASNHDAHVRNRRMRAARGQDGGARSPRPVGPTQPVALEGRVRPENLGGLAELAALLGTRKGTLSMQMLRGSWSGPAPVARVTATPLWDLEEVRGWLAASRTGRAAS